MDQAAIERILTGCELFRDLEQSDIERIVRLCRLESFEGGTEVIQQGDFVKHMYIIADGRVMLERSTNLGNRQGVMPVDVLGKGRVFGCWSTLLDEPHILMCTVTCQKPTKTLVIEGSELRKVMLSDKELGFKILQNLCLYLRKRLHVLYGAMEKI